MPKVIIQNIQRQKCLGHGSRATRKTTDEISYFEMLAQQVQQASPGDIEEIREELAEQGYLKLRHAKKKKNKRNLNQNAMFLLQV